MAAEGPLQEAPRGSRFVSELGTRVLSGAILALVALFATYQGGWIFALLWLLAGVTVLLEWIGMTKAEPRVSLQIILGAGLLALSAVQLAEASWIAGLTATACSIAAALVLGATNRDRLWAVTGFACSGIIILIPPIVREHPDLGIVGVLWMFAVVWTTDVAAYFTGRRIGGPKLWPAVSPKKTWAGFAGGLMAGTLAGVAVPLLSTRAGWVQPVATIWIALLSMFSSILSQGGDLAESALKRHFGVKDSGRIIPGHGGVMDRLDGFWAVALFVGAILVGARFGN